MTIEMGEINSLKGLFGTNFKMEDIILDTKDSEWVVNKLEKGKQLDEMEETKTLATIKLDNYMDNVELFWRRKPFFYDKANIFWVWHLIEKKYEMADDTTMMLLIDASLGLEGQTVNTRIKSNYIEAFKRVGRKHIPEPAPNKWIQFKDQAFSLKSGKIYDVKPNFFFTNPIPHELGETEETPTMDKLIIEWVGEKYKETAYEIIAYCCLNDYPIHLIFCLVGCGRNGKSKFLGMITKFIGKENVCSTELDLLLDSRFESFKLYKKLVCMMGETNFGILNKTSLLKRLTGQDLIGFEFKNKKPFDDYNYAKIMISSNSLPTTEDTSEGFYRRWLIVDFSNIFPEGNDILKTIPNIEYNNLCKKIINILPKLIEKGKFKKQGTIAERKHKYIMSSNPLSYFIEKACDKDHNLFMRYSELFVAYRQYLNLLKRRAISYKEFNEVLSLEGLEVQRTSKNMNGEWIRGRFINGIELKLEWEKEEFVSNVSVVQQVTLRTHIKSLSGSGDTNDTNDTKEDIEELITPYIGNCKACGASHCHFSYKGNYFCSKDCIKAYKVNTK